MFFFQVIINVRSIRPCESPARAVGKETCLSGLQRIRMTNPCGFWNWSGQGGGDRINLVLWRAWLEFSLCSWHAVCSAAVHAQDGNPVILSEWEEKCKARSRQSWQRRQRPWGRNVLGPFGKKKRGQCGWKRVEKVIPVCPERPQFNTPNPVARKLLSPEHTPTGHPGLEQCEQD